MWSRGRCLTVRGYRRPDRCQCGGGERNGKGRLPVRAEDNGKDKSRDTAEDIEEDSEQDIEKGVELDIGQDTELDPARDFEQDSS